MDQREDFDRFAAGRAAALLRFTVLLTPEPGIAERAVGVALGRTRAQWRGEVRDTRPEDFARRQVVRAVVGRVPRSVVALGTGAVPVPSDEEGAEHTSVEVLTAVLTELTPAGRAVCALRHRDDADTEQIASLLGTSQRTVSRLDAEVTARLARHGALRGANGAPASRVVRVALETVERERFAQVSVAAVPALAGGLRPRPWWIAAALVVLLALGGVGVIRAARVPAPSNGTISTSPQAVAAPGPSATTMPAVFPPVLASRDVRMQLPTNWTFSAEVCGIAVVGGTYSPIVACRLDRKLQIRSVARLAYDDSGYGKAEARVATRPVTVLGHPACRGITAAATRDGDRTGVLHLLDQGVVVTVRGSSVAGINQLLDQVWIVSEPHRSGPGGR